MRNRNRIVYLLIGLSALPLLAAIPTYGLVYDDSFKSIARIIAIVFGQTGVLLLIWQLILGSRSITRLVTQDWVFVNDLHKFIGKYGALLIFAHPALLLVQYGFEYLLGLSSFENPALVLGKAAILVLGIIWVTSALLRGRLKFRPWKYIHFLAYLILPLAIFHSISIGTVLNLSGLVNYWQVILVGYVLLITFRVAHQLGFGRMKYRIVELRDEANMVKSLVMEPVKKTDMFPLPGQFIYIQNGLFSESHPFTVSDFDAGAATMTLSIKAFGRFTRNLHNLTPGKVVFIDGPFGVFTAPNPVSAPMAIFIAGGIGITPFRRFFMRNPNLSKFQEVYLFYACRSMSDMAFREELAKVQKQFPNIKVVQIFSEGEIPAGCEQGVVSVDMLRKYVTGDLANYTYYLCGPVGMMASCQRFLTEAGVSAERIISEKFDM